MSDGNYENEIRSTPNLISDRTCKRLLSAMQYGVVITHGNGHRWIYCIETDENEQTIDEALRKIGKPVMRGKCYGSVVEALDRVDGALKVLGWPSLMEAFESDSSYDAWG